MKKIIITVLAIAILIGGYVFIKDQQIKAELSKVEESKEVESNIKTDEASGTKTTTFDSQITLNRSNGVWKVDSTGEYTIDTSSLKFEFTGYKPGGQHIGTFNTMDALILLDKEGNPLISQITLDPAGIKTDDKKLDEHLQSSDFFDTTKYPEISVVVKEIQKDGMNIKAITDLTMKGVTKTLAIPVKVTPTNGGVMFDIDTRIKISEYSIAYGPVLDEVRVMLSGVLKKK